MATTPAGGARELSGEQLIPIDEGWAAIPVAPGAIDSPQGLGELELWPANVPGTAAAVRAATAAAPAEGADLDAEDWWFRTVFAAEPAAAGERVTLELDGIATVSEVFLNGERILESSSMFARHSLDVGAALAPENELAIRCRALGPLLAERRRPRARWRTRLVAEANLRFFRTMLLGRAPGFAPGPPAVGPWRPIRLRRRHGLDAEWLRLRPRIDGPDGADGRLAVEVGVRALGDDAPESIEVELNGPSGSHRTALALERRGEGLLAGTGELTIPGVARWWPHTHGDPTLHSVRLVISTAAGDHELDGGRVGFRSLAAGAPGREIEADGLALQLNGVEVFARGAVWTPIDPIGLAPSEAELRAAITTAREAGINVLRVVGTAAYEAPAFHELCDELGMLVWQDFMFANLDYPIADEGFRTLVEAEAEQVTGRLARHPSTVVFCGNSEVEQQAAMFGVDPALGRGELFAELLPAAVAASGSDAIYLPSAPFGGDLPFRPDRGVANYFGVGGYRRPLEDARRADVRFASECLAFANVPDSATLALLAGATGEARADGAAWKAGVPRDAGADWDFDDVRDHYLELLFGVDPAQLRDVDPERYLELSRAVSGEVMAEVFGEWRRAGSRCAGGIVLWLRDLVPGAGWGLVDSEGRPKVALHHLRRALAPVAVWTTDEGLGGIGIEVANDRPEPLTAQLRVGLYRNREQPIGAAEEPVELGPNGALSRNVEGLLGRFADAAYAYRFGPSEHDLVVVTLEPTGGGEPISQSFRFPVGRPLERESPAELGLEATLAPGGAPRLTIRSRRLAYGVRVAAAGFSADDDAFSIEPGGERTVGLSPITPGAELSGATLTALNLGGELAAATGPAGDRRR